MEFIEPSKIGFTVYSKSGCTNCLKIKSLLKEKNLVFQVIDCDEYILEEKDSFLLFIQNLIQSSKNETRLLFPIVFNDKHFVGGYKETCEYIDKLLLSLF